MLAGSKLLQPLVRAECGEEEEWTGVGVPCGEECEEGGGVVYYVFERGGEGVGEGEEDGNVEKELGV